MKDIKMIQNWMSKVGFWGKKEYGYKVNDGDDGVFTDYVEIRLDPSPEHKIYKDTIEYTEKDWHEENPNATKFIERDGKWHGDYSSDCSGYTMHESVDRIIAYVHFTHDTHDFNNIFFECGDVCDRDDIDVDDTLSKDEMQEIIDFAKECLKNDLTKANKHSQWMYSDCNDNTFVMNNEENSKVDW